MPTRQELLGVLEALDTDGLDAALQALDALKGYDKERRLYAVWCARQVQHLMTDPRSLAALDVAERHAHGQATDKELKAAADAASDTAWDAASDAAWDAASDAASDAAWDAARDAADAAAYIYTSVVAVHTAYAAARNAKAAKLCETIEVSLCRQDTNSCTYSPP